MCVCVFAHMCVCTCVCARAGVSQITFLGRPFYLQSSNYGARHPLSLSLSVVIKLYSVSSFDYVLLM